MRTTAQRLRHAIYLYIHAGLAIGDQPACLVAQRRRKRRYGSRLAHDLGMGERIRPVYAALGRTEEARTELEAAIALIEGDGLRREALAEIEEALAGLSSNASSAEN